MSLLPEFTDFLHKFDHFLNQFRELFLLLEGENLLINIEDFFFNGIHFLIRLGLINESGLLLYVCLEVVENFFCISNEIVVGKELECKESLNEKGILSEVFCILLSSFFSQLHLPVGQVNDLILGAHLHLLEPSVLLVVKRVLQVVAHDAVHLLNKLQ